ncbi:MAG: type III-B CRISPR-associated protein Cas10/Cmr2 [Anaerolineae bacterium]|nr:type III-B CRISPR-associated protein Cas10/Cmr2 [Anaerolineae bacterium]
MERVTIPAILVVSLGPVQSFIAEARRISDLQAGSDIVVRLARAAGDAIVQQGGSLIYPAELTGDLPNKLVARVAAEQVDSVARAVRDAIDDEWASYVENARRFLESNGPTIDDRWRRIWDRQVGGLWQTYWAAVPEDGSYQAAYDTASRALDAVKRTRAFRQAVESGEKDTVSGRRSALRVESMTAHEYWASVAQSGGVTSAALRAEGRERLDALGAIKRWGGLAAGAPSVSQVATADFVQKARKEKAALAVYRRAVELLLGDLVYRVSSDPDWPYDGDLFFRDTLTRERLAGSYGLEESHEPHLEAARLALSILHNRVGHGPRSYYAIIALDGDSMGEMVSKCKTEAEHRDLSRKLSDFAAQVPRVVEESMGHLVYAGGDDVLALAPLSTAVTLVRQLARDFSTTVNGATASAGIAIAHHLHPLDAVLAAARAAGRRAKEAYEEKAALCVRVLRRSGQRSDVGSSWDAMGDTFEQLVDLFQRGTLASRFPYTVLESAYALSQANTAFRAELGRLVRRHSDSQLGPEDQTMWTSRLGDWSARLPGKVALEGNGQATHMPPGAPIGGDEPQRSQTEELGDWLILARFVAQGGGE